VSENNDPDTAAWHLDKRIPIALIVTIFLQTAFAVSWVTSLSARVDGAIEVNQRQDQRIAATEGVVNDQAIILATVAAQITAMTEKLSDLKQGVSETNRLLRGLEARSDVP
jgi:uncharacterized coiled-coil protein SlyX